jgi:hypothetical protein
VARIGARDHEHGTVRVVDDGVRDAAEQDRLDRGMPALADHDQLCVGLTRDLEDRLPDAPDARLRPRLAPPNQSGSTNSSGGRHT